MTRIASYSIPRPLRDVLLSDAKQSAEAVILEGSRICLAAGVVFAVAYSTPSILSTLAQRNIVICIGGCLSLPATILAMGSLGLYRGASHLIQGEANKTLMRGAGLVVASYAALEFHDLWKFGLLEPLLSRIGKKLAEPCAKGMRISSTFLQRYFPPQPLKDVNPFNMRSQKDAERVLLAAQRIAAGALMAFLLFRYSPVLKRMQGGRLLPVALFAGCYSLSVPATLLATSAFMTSVLMELILKQQLTKETLALVGVNYLVWSGFNAPFSLKFMAGVTLGGLIWMGKLPLTPALTLLGTLESFHLMRGYKEEIAPTPLMPHFFNKIFQSSPNLLDRVFVRVAERYSGAAFRYLGRAAK